MLLKFNQAQKRIKASCIGKPSRTAGGMVKLTSGMVTVVPKIHRKVIKIASKRPAAIHRSLTGVKREQIPVDPCDNSNDSGLGFDHHLDYHSTIASHSALCFSDKETGWQTEDSLQGKRRRLEIKLESDDANDNFTFPQTVRQPVPRATCVPVRGRANRVVVPVTLSSQLSATSHNGLTQLLIACQPEQQHRARYQTEGSRGAVKDRTGNGFPVVKLIGYDRPATLQVFIGTDQGRVAPHMFYQACRVSGKNSTPCVEKKVDGTIVIEVDIEPSKDMVVTCDCVGILKERNVDVEHRFPEEGSGRSKKKSTRCRMVFRTVITHPDGTQETLQVTSQPIVCTQPPGVPEICKKSLSTCSVRGGQELFILGKNFLKDTRVIFQEGDPVSPSWSQSVQPDKEFLQQSHLVCVVPPYHRTDILEPVTVRLLVESSGKASEAHTIRYLPDNTLPDTSSVLVSEGNVANNSVVSQGGSTAVFPGHLPHPVSAPLLLSSESSAAATYIATQTSTGREEKVRPVIIWDKPVPVEVMMPPPLMPISARRSSVQMIVPEPLAPEDLKREVLDEAPKPLSDLSNTQQPSMDTFHRFVTNNSLPSISVENYLSNLEVPRIMIPSSTTVNKPLTPNSSPNVMATVEPILVNQPVVMPFDGRNDQTTHENISVIVSSPMIQKTEAESHANQDAQQHKQITETQNVGLDLLMASALNNQIPTMTEKLDAFVNSAAESHISPNTTPTITSVITENSVVNSISDIVVNGTNDMNKLQDPNIPSMIQTSSLPISPHTNHHHGSANMNEGPLCSLINSSPQTTNQEQVVSSIQTSLNHHLNNQSVNTAQASVNDLMQSPPQVSAGQVQVYSDLQTSLEQITSQTVTSSQMTNSQINSLIQSSQQTSTNQAQELSNLQASLEQHLSPSTMNSDQLIHPDLNNMMQPSQTSTSQEQALSNLQATLEQQMSSQALSSQSPVRHSDLRNLIQSTSQEADREAQALSNLQVSLEQHLSSQTMNSAQRIHPESIQPSNLTLASIGKAIQNEDQNLSNLQVTLEHHMSPQMINTVRAAHESLTNGSITMNSLNSSVPASPQIAVSQAQVFSNFHASLEHHLASQVVGSVQSVHEAMTQNSQNSTVESSPQVTVNQSQALSGLQMSLEHLSPQILTSPQPTHMNMSVGSISLNNSIPTSQVQISASQAEETLSKLQASLEHHLTSEAMTVAHSSESSMPLENSPVQTSPQHSSNQNISSLQASIDQLSSQVLSSSQSSHSGNLTPNNLNINDSQSIDMTSPLSLMSSQAINVVSDTSTASSPVVVLSPNSRHSPSSGLTTPGLSLSNTPTMVLSPANSLAMDMTPPNLVLNTSHTIMSATDLVMSSPSRLLSQSDLQMQNSQSVQLQNSISQFEQVTSRIPDKIVAMSQYHQQEMQTLDKETDRKEPPSYAMPSGAVNVQPQTNFEMKPEASGPTTKKCEEGMPLPNELTQMSEHDLISYINPSCFDAV